MSNLSLSANGYTSTPSAPANFSAPPGGNAATATTVANLFRQGRQGEAVATLMQAKQGQPQAVQDALDRMVSSRLGACLDAAPSSPWETIQASPADTGNTIRQINEAADRPAMPDTSGLSTEQKFDVYSSIIATRGDQAAVDALTSGKTVILGLRVEDSSLVNHGQGVYDDRVVVLSKTALGAAQVHEFNRASTDPTAQYDANQRDNPAVKFRKPLGGKDVDGDGINELGRLAEGTVEMAATQHRNPLSAGGTKFSLRPSNLAVAHGRGMIERDSNHDGNFVRNDARTDLDNSFKIHAGSLTNTDSAGCTTIYPKDFANFEAAVTVNGSRRGAQERWQYVLTSVRP